MTGREWFIVGARLFGLWVLWGSLSFVSVIVEMKFDIEQPRDRYSFGTCVIQAMWQFPFAWVLLAKAEVLAGFLFDGFPPPPNGPNTDADQSRSQ